MVSDNLNQRLLAARECEIGSTVGYVTVGASIVSIPVLSNIENRDTRDNVADATIAGLLLGTAMAATYVGRGIIRYLSNRDSEEAY
tara:strand:+ start:177 stop:434 length:258 start_codon:yes stop_codon:yes gene_type:complete